MVAALLGLWALPCFAQKDYTDALSLTVVGKYTETQHPWDRLD
jgi:hypothetical protein